MGSVLTKRWAKWILPTLLISIVIYVAYGHSLVFDGKTLAPVKGNPWLDPGAAYWANAATAKLINLLLGQGELPLWADQIGVGVPLFSDPHNAFFSPFSFILYAFPSSSGWDAMTLIRLFILIFTSYLLFHRVLLSDKESTKVTAFTLSLFAAILFGFSGHVFYFLNLFHLNSLAFAPLFLLGAIETLENKLSKGLLFVTVSMALMIFGGGLLDVILVTVLLFFIVLAYFFQHLNQLNQTSARLSWLVVFGLLSLLLSAVFILPYIELRSISIEPFRGRSTAYFNSYWYSISLFFHELTVTPENASNYYMKYRQYLHIITLPGLVYSLTLLSPSRSRFSYVFVGAWIYILFYVAKLHGVDYLNFINDMPLLQDIRFNKYQGVLHFSVYMLSAAGLFAAFSDKQWGLRLLAVLLVLASLAMPYAYLIQQGIPVGYKVHFYAGLLLALLALLMLHWHRQHLQHKGKVNRLALSMMLIGATGLLIAQVYIDLNKTRAEMTELFPMDEQRKTLLNIVEDNRVMPMFGSAPRIWSANGFHDVRNFSVVFSERYLTLFKNKIEKNACWHWLILCSDKADTIDLSLLSYIGTRYVLIRDDQITALNQNQYKSHNVIQSVKGSSVVELANHTSIASLSSNITLVSTDELQANLAKFAQQNTGMVYVEDATALQHGLSNQLPNENSSSIEVLARSSGRIRLLVDAKQAGMLVYNNQYFPGWKAYVDGERVEIYRANYLFQGVGVSAGKSVIEFVFLPNTFLLGLFLAALGFILIIILQLRFKHLHSPQQTIQDRSY